jgi:flagellar assembly protein FliH
MAKAVFRPDELTQIGAALSLEAPFADKKEEAAPETGEISEAIPVFEGPTADDLKREADAFKAQWDAEKAAMLDSARTEAEIIVTTAKKAAEEDREKFEAELRACKDRAGAEAEAIVNKAREASAQMEAASGAKQAETAKAAAAEGFEAGRKEGYEAGMSEAKRLIARTQLIMERIQDRRAEIIAQAEQEIIDFALLVSRKVVKVISETQRQVVAENIKEALGKVKTRGKVIVKVNTADLETATAHLDEFIKLLESSGDIQILEDSSIDPGGCYIETDFGEIDARIAVQFAELESKILEISPVKAKQGVYKA